MEDDPRILSPLEIKTLLDIHTTPLPLQNQSEPVLEFLQWAESRRVIQEDAGASGWKLTPRGEAFVWMMRTTPLPVETYVDPRTNYPVRIVVQ